MQIKFLFIYWKHDFSTQIDLSQNLNECEHFLKANLYPSWI